MNKIVSANGVFYRKWVNVVLSLLLDGSAHYLAGRKKRGIIWAMIILLFELSAVFTFISPLVYWPLSILIAIILILDSFRFPIPKMSAKAWAKGFGSFLLIVLVIPTCIILGARQFFIQPFTVPTGTMQPTIRGITEDENGNKLPGDQILVSKTAYLKHPPRRGDIVVFSTDSIDHPIIRKNTFYIKRIVGLPGETVSIDPPNLIVNGQAVTRPKIFKAITARQNGYHGYVLANKDIDGALLTGPEKSITLADDEYLVFGDNSKNSLDSRYFGPIQKSAILGKVVYRYAPANRKGPIE